MLIVMLCIVLADQWTKYADSCERWWGTKILVEVTFFRVNRHDPDL